MKHAIAHANVEVERDDELIPVGHCCISGSSRTSWTNGSSSPLPGIARDPVEGEGEVAGAGAGAEAGWVEVGGEKLDPHSCPVEWDEGGLSWAGYGRQL